jgi:hypothetical protein
VSELRLSAGAITAARDEGEGVIQVVLRYRSGQQREVLLAGVPRVGDRVLLRPDNGPADTTSLMVEQVLWVEGAELPTVVISVRPSDGP